MKGKRPESRERKDGISGVGRRKRESKEIEDLKDRYLIELQIASGENWAPPPAPPGDADCKETAADASNTEISETSILTKFKFSDLPISRASLLGLQKVGYVNMSQIQLATIPHALKGRDVLGEAKTGSGKTVAFLVPILERLFVERCGKQDGLCALVLSPTRELTEQIYAVLAAVGRFHEFSAGLIFGGKSMKAETSCVEFLNILVATPGRLLHHLHETAGFCVDNLKILVIDEADRMVDMGFVNIMEEISNCLPPVKLRQNLLFSATLSVSIRMLTKKFCHNPEMIFVNSDNGGEVSDVNLASPSPSSLRHYYLSVCLEDKVDALYSFIRSHWRRKIVVFVSSCKQARFLGEIFRKIKTGGSKVYDLHGRQSQDKRLETFHEFADRENSCVLIATDIASRGLDIPDVDWVVQLDCPPDVETYIHRIGRTARCGTSGSGLLFLLNTEIQFLSRLSAKHIQVDRKVMSDSHIIKLQTKLQSLLAQWPYLRELAQKFIITYVRHYSLMRDKQVFPIAPILTHLKDLAAHLGLPYSPQECSATAAGATTTPNLDTTATATAAEDDGDFCTGVVRDTEAKAKKNMTKLEKFKAKLRAKKLKAVSKEPKDESDDDDFLKKSSKNQDDDDDGEFVKEQQGQRKKQPAVEKPDWRSLPTVKKSLAKQRIRIRADGTAKLQGAANLVPNDHIFFDDDDDDDETHIVETETYEQRRLKRQIQMISNSAATATEPLIDSMKDQLAKRRKIDKANLAEVHRERRKKRKLKLSQVED